VNLKGVWNAVHHPVVAISLEGRKELTSRPTVGVSHNKAMTIKIVCRGNLEINLLRCASILQKAGLISTASSAVLIPSLLEI
jgi:hypothetical protein